MAFQVKLFNTGTATFDSTGRFRYTLWRDLGDIKNSVCFIMLNPSKADATINDPTVRRCMGFAKSWGFGGLCVANLYALMATDPKELRPDPIAAAGDPGNMECIIHLAKKANLVVAAWGVNPGRLAKNGSRRDELVTSKLHEEGISLKCLETTKGGFPRHPLYCKASLKPGPFPAEQPTTNQ